MTHIKHKIHRTAKITGDIARVSPLPRGLKNPTALTAITSDTTPRTAHALSYRYRAFEHAPAYEHTHARTHTNHEHSARTLCERTERGSFS